jgi:two-component system sensor histidine kinase CiaH
VFTDSEGEVTGSSSPFDLTDEFYQLLAESAIERNAENGRFRIDDRNWAFRLRPLPGGYALSFLDVTAQQSILTRLIYTFAIVGAVMLLLIFLVSRFFANRAIKPIRDAFEKQKQFIADASHEIKTSLAVINTNIDLLLGGGERPARDYRKWLGYIKAETERMTRLTNDLLYLAKVDQSQARRDYTRVDLSRQVQDAALTMEAVFFEKGISFEHNVETKLLVTGDGGQLRQVVVILLDNALKYCDAGGTVGLTLHRHNQLAVLRVTNTGRGVRSDHLDRIFDRFYRSDPSRSRSSGGYGLGLAIAKSIVENHGGRIRAESVPEESMTLVAEFALITD